MVVSKMFTQCMLYASAEYSFHIISPKKLVKNIIIFWCSTVLKFTARLLSKMCIALLLWLLLLITL